MGHSRPYARNFHQDRGREAVNAEGFTRGRRRDIKRDFTATNFALKFFGSNCPLALSMYGFDVVDVLLQDTFATNSALISKCDSFMINCFRVRNSINYVLQDEL